MTIQEIRTQFPNTFNDCAKWLSKVLTQEQYKAFGTYHYYIQYVFYMDYFFHKGYNIAKHIKGYNDLGVEQRPSKSLIESVEGAFLVLEQQNSKELWE